MTTVKQVEDALWDKFDTFSKRDGVFTVRRSFFYTHGIRVSDKVDEVKAAFPEAEIVEAREVRKVFRGGASIANSSHWFVKFKLS